MENNLRHSLHVILNSAMKEKDEFINKICDMIENKECDCKCNCSTIDLESGKKVTKERCDCMTSGECCCGDDCKCHHHHHHHHHKHMAHALIRELEKISQSINDLNETLKQDRK